MKVVFCSSEVFPFAKTGGLADVSGALPFALAKQGCQVKVFMPLYKNINPNEVYPDYGKSKTKLGGIEFYFIKNDNYFLRDGLYGTSKGDYPDNLERFLFFNEKVVEILKKENFSADIIHCNDWQTSLLIVLIKVKYKNESLFKSTATILTIHNLAYQGIFEKDKFPLLGISWDYFSLPYLEYYQKINLLKGGIIFADMVNTVSPSYAEQIRTLEYGCGLDGVLREKGERLVGILNAIDYKVWNPKKDKLIYKNYSPDNLEDKYINKVKLQDEVGLNRSKRTFLLGMVSRLAEQKGVDILAKALDKIVKYNQVVILGFGEEFYHKILKNKEKKYKGNLAVILKFDEALAHKIYAGVDAFLMPSRFEPCGLSQMISYKYATIPIVHHTGGLKDTVLDYREGGCGFIFNEYSPKALISTVDRAAELFANRKEWFNLLKKAVKLNYSWQKTAKEYIKMYRVCQSLL